MVSQRPRPYLGLCRTLRFLLIDFLWQLKTSRRESLLDHRPLALLRVTFEFPPKIDWCSSDFHRPCRWPCRATVYAAGKVHPASTQLGRSGNHPAASCRQKGVAPKDRLLLNHAVDRDSIVSNAIDKVHFSPPLVPMIVIQIALKHWCHLSSPVCGGEFPRVSSNHCKGG